MKAERASSRILFLDGLRCVAVSAVILFHYFSRWTQPWNSENLYPYGDAFWRYFRLGFYGVPLFFMISGFVITLSLYRCSTFQEFVIRRLARLWPTMLLCSLVTLTLTSILPNHNFHVSPLGLLPSLTFIDPLIFNRLFHTRSFDWIDGSYWSLFVEVRFYLIAAVLFFWKPNRFSQSFFCFSFVILGLEFFGVAVHSGKLVFVLDLAFAADRLPWFLLGVSLYFFIEGTRTTLHYYQFAVGLFESGPLRRPPVWRGSHHGDCHPCNLHQRSVPHAGHVAAIAQVDGRSRRRIVQLVPDPPGAWKCADRVAIKYLSSDR